VKPSDIGAYVTTSSPAVSPDGGRIVFAVQRVDVEANKYRSQLWVVPSDGSAPGRPLTNGERGDGNPVWSPRGDRLAFTSRRNGDETATLHVLPMDGPGETTTIASVPESVSDLTWSPDGAWLAFSSRTPAVPASTPDHERSPRTITRFFSRLDGEGFVFDRPQHVYVVPSDGTAPPRNLTPGEFQFHSPAWLPDSSGVICSGAGHDSWDRDLAEDLYLVPLDGERRALTQQTGMYGQPSVSPDGTRVAFLGGDHLHRCVANSHVGVLDLGTGAKRWVSTDLDRTFTPYPGAFAPLWDGDSLVVSAEDRGDVRLYRVPADGSAPPEPITAAGQQVVAAHLAGGVLAGCVATFGRPAELYRLDLHGADPQRLSHVTDRFTAAVAPLPAERFTAPSSGGVEVDVWVVLPPDRDPDARYPVLLNVHGGPFTQYGNRFFDEAQLQASHGYVVVLSNPRGSSGRENAWSQAINGPRHPLAPGTGWGSVDVDDVLAALDGALRRFPDVCDPARVGMLGGSYGGYMASWLAGHSNRFAAICSERAVNNLTSLEWNSDIATAFRIEHGATHLEAPEEYARMSPITYVRDIATPVLLVHSEDDLRCPIAQAEELFVALRLLDKPVEFVRFPAEGHELSRSGSPKHRIHRAEVILDFFDRHLRDHPE
jgi:dipeptidyl aminopeptidase/acylaminoacyl peptidase